MKRTQQTRKDVKLAQELINREFFECFSQEIDISADKGRFPVHAYEIPRVMEKLHLKEKEQPSHFIAYTDGSNNNLDSRRPAGAAYVILDHNGNELHRASKGLLGKTNNFVEMLAIISAVNWVPAGASVTVHSDSQYAIGVLSGQMKAKKNLNLIERYRQVSKNKDVSFEWVRGHSGNHWNEVCDKMARAEYEKMKL